ncbi:MAG: hypothetical protein KDK28_14640 [Maritimibacter sp.]|nr:hypothetical protein [Maritimibacter sp.]
MQAQTLALFAGAVILWFALSFVTKTWAKQWAAAVIAGLTTAWWRWSTMQDVAASQGIAPMSPVRFGLIAVAGMLILATAGMGLYMLMKQMRR